MRPIVVDTNVVIAALVTREPDSPPARIIQLARSGGLSLLLSRELIDEYREVLLRARIVKRHGRTPDEIDHMLAEIEANGLTVEPILGDPIEGPDPDDAHLWRLLKVRGDAVLVTGDQKLIDDPPLWSTVMSPRQWLEGFIAAQTPDRDRAE